MNKKLRELSQNMRELGEMHPSYKGFGMYSSVSPELQKAILYYSITNFSLINIDASDNKIVWYNISIFNRCNKAIIYYNKKYILCVKKENTIQIFYHHEIPLIESVDIFDNCIIEYVQNRYKNNIYTLIMQYMDMEVNTNKVEKMRLIIGTEMYQYMKEINKTPNEFANEFTKYLCDIYEKTIYVVC
jgi:hypothetical protein